MEEIRPLFVWRNPIFFNRSLRSSDFDYLGIASSHFPVKCGKVVCPGPHKKTREGDYMGLLSFAKNIGKKLFSREEEASPAIKAHVEEDNPGVSNLNVEINDGVVSLSGEAESAEALEKAVLIAGNVEGVSEVKYENVSAPAAVEEVDYYEIVSGDTLSAIAKKFYGKSSEYPRIFEANKEVIKDPNKIYVGQKIRIPK